MIRRARNARSVFLDAPHASGRGFDGQPANRVRGWRRLMPMASFVGVFAVLLTSLTFPTTAAHAYEVPTTGPAVGSMVESAGSTQFVQTQASGLVVTYDALNGSIPGRLSTDSVVSATASQAGGSPTLSTNASLAQLLLSGPTSSAEQTQAGCVSSSNPARRSCASLGQLRVTFSQPVNDPKIYIGRLGGSYGSVVNWANGRLTASTAASAVNLTGLDTTGGISAVSLVNNGWKVGDSVTGTSEIGLTCSASPSAGCMSFTAAGTGITSLTFALDFISTGNTDGLIEIFTVGVSTPQQFSTAPVSYNGAGGNSAPFHVPSDLRFGTAVNAAGISTTQNTTASPVVKTTPTTVNTGTGAGDGLATLPKLLATTANQSITIPVSGVSKPATVAGWIDWNKNGVFDAAERVSTSIGIGATSATLTVAAPAGTLAGQFYSRFRTSYTAADVANATGAASSGEVEDYAIVLKPTITVANSASSSAGTFDLKVANSAGTTTTVQAGAAAGQSSGAKSIFNNSTYGAPDLVVAQNPLTTAMPLTVSQTQTSAGTYKVSYVCVSGAGAVSSGSLSNSIQGTTSTIPSFSIPGASTSGTTAVRQAISCTFTNQLISVDAVDDSITVAQNAATAPATNVLANDTASNTTIDPTKVTITTQPLHGTVVVNATTGAITYTPASNYTGTDSYVYQVCGVSPTNAVCDTATVNVTVGANVVTAVANSASTTPGVAVTTNVLANDTISSGGAPLNKTTVAVSTAAAHGTTAVNSTSGNITYTPTAGFSGTDTYSYTVCDTSTPTIVCGTAQVTVQVPNAFTPGPGLDSLTTPQNAPITTTLSNLVSTTGAPVDPAKVTQSVAPAHGTLSINSTTGAVTYQPATGFTGSDSYQLNVCDKSLPTSVCTTITVTVQVGANNVVTAADAASTPVSTAVTLNVLANDSVQTGGAPLNPSTVSVTVAPTNGTTAVNATTGAVTYTPTGNFTGKDTFTYKVCDTSNPTPVCGTAVGTITVNNVFIDGVAATGISTPQNSPITSALSSISSTTGAALDPTKVTQATAPTHGALTINASTGAVTYTPTAGYTGSDSYDVKVCDLSVPSQCDTVTIPVTVGANVVTAVNDTASTTVGTAVSVPVVSNDTVKSGGAPLNNASVTVTAAPSNGTTSVNTTTGAVSYTPTAGFSGQDTFTYKVCDTSSPTALCATALATVTVNNVFTDGVAASGVSTTQNTPISTPLTSISTTSGAALNPTKVTVATAPLHGALTINATTGAVTYTPNAGYTGSDSYDISVCDVSVPSQCDTVTIPVTVGANVVTAVNDSASTTVGTLVSVPVVANDTVRAGGAPLNKATVAVTVAPSHGSTTVNTTTGAVAYTPTAGFSGQDTFTYKVCDTSNPIALCDTAVATITVNNVFADGVAASGITTPQNTAITTPLSSISTTSGAALDPTKVTQATAPTHGALTINATTGAVIYTPTAGYTGPDSYTVSVCDLSVPSQCDTVTIPVVVGANAVTAVDDTASTTVGTAVSVPVVSNDTVPSGGAPLDKSSVTVTVAPSNGTTSVNTTTGAVTYTPTAGFSGQDTFTYKVCDTSSPTALCDTAVATITVNNVFTDGVAASGISTPQNAPITSLLSTITSTTGSALDPTKVTQATAPTHGALTINASTGAVTYTPTAGYTGADSYDIKVCDLSVPSQCDTVTIPVTVGANVVTAVDDTASTTVGTAVSVPIVSNDTVKSGGAPLNKASVVVTVAPSNGTTSVNTTTGAVSYTPTAGFSGQDTFTYKVCDTSSPTALCGTAVATITVNNVFTDGVAASGVTTPQNTAISTPLTSISSTSGAALDPTKVTETTAPTHGALTISPTTGAVTYTPTAGYTGSDSYTVSVCDVSVPSQCDTVTIPVTVGANVVTAVDDAASTTVGTAVSVPVVSNDTVKSGGAPLNNASVTVTVAPNNGTASVNTTTGAVTYTPTAGFSGQDTFTYKVCDTSNPTALCDTAIATVTVNNVFTDGVAATGISTPQNTAISTPLTSISTTSGKALDPTKVTEATAPTHGVLTISATTGAVTYTPTAGYTGPDSYDIKVCDLSVPSQCDTVTIPVTVGANVVTAVDDAASTTVGTLVSVPVLTNDTVRAGGAALKPSTVSVTVAPSNGTTSVNTTTGAVSYTPTAGFSGQDTFTYKVCDTSNPTALCDTAVATITVNNVFTDGVAASGVTTPQNTAITTPVTSISTTSGAALDPTKVTQTTAPTHGALSISTTTGAVTYTPTAGYTGSDSYTVSVCDVSVPSQCDTVTIPVIVGANAVTAVDDAASTTVGTAVSVPVVSNDTVKAGGAALNNASVVVTVAPSNGTTSVNTTTGAVTYTPAAGFSGQDTFTYKVCDTSSPTALCDTALATVTVNNVFTDGVAASGVTTPQNTAISTPLASISTTSGKALDPAKVTQATAPTHGALTISTTTGAVTYTPTAGYTGSDSYTVTVCDLSVPSQCDTVTIPVTVGVNAVTATADTASTTVGSAVSVPVLTNDSVSTGGAALDPSTASVTVAPANGLTAVNSSTGVVTYTPAAGFSGQDTFTYKVCDTSNPTAICATAIATVTVNNVFTDGVAASGVTTPQNTAISTPLTSISTTSGKALDPTKVTQATAPAHGALTINATTGAVTYTPTAGYTGPDSYTVSVCDLSSPSQCDTVTIPVTVAANAVTATADAASTTVGTVVSVPVLTNDTVRAGGAALNPSTVTVTTAAANGLTSVNTTTGAVSYTPAAGFSGQDSFTYKVCDTSNPTAICDTAVATITVNNVFTDGVAASGVTTPQNTAISTPLASISTTSGKALDPTKVTQATAPTHGALTISATTGAVTYTPTAGYTGSDSYDVTVCDTSVPSQCDTVTIPVVIGANAVTAVDDAASTTVGTAVSVPVVSNDTVKSGGAPLSNASVAVTVAPSNGTTSVNTTTGAVSYTPAAGFSGKDTFSYKVCDTSNPTALCDTAEVTVTVANAFVAGTGGVSTPQNVAVSTPLAAIVTTTGAAIDPTKVTSNTAPAHGGIVINPSTGAVTYTPTAGYTGLDSYKVDVCDLSVPSQCSTITVPVTVGANIVTAEPDAATTSAITPVSVPVLSNDTISAGGAPLNKSSVTIPVNAAHGVTAVNTTTGAVTYTAATGFSGTDSFEYRVCDTTNPVPVCDTAVATITVKNVFTDGPAVAGISTLQNTDVTTPLVDIVTVTGSPVDATSVTETTPPAHGSIAINPTTGAVVYSPDSNYSGSDSYVVKVCDTATTPECTTVTVTVVVGTNAVMAAADSGATDAGSSVTTNVITNDTVAGAGAGLNPASLSVTVAPAHGTTSVNSTTGAVTYTPATGFSGTDSYTYRVCDSSVPTPVCGSAVVTVTVTNVFVPGPGTVGGAPGSIATAQNAPITVPTSAIVSTTGLPINPATLAVKPGSTPANGSVAIDPITGQVTFTPTPGYSGPDTFVVTFCDTGSPAACGEQTVTVTVAVNVVTPKPDSAKVGFGDTAVISPLDNDVSASRQALDRSSVRIGTQPSHGTVSVNAITGALSYTPATGWMGTDEFTYTVCDTSFPTPVCGTTTVSLTTLPAALAYTGGTVLIGLQLALASLLGGIVLLLFKRRTNNREAARSAQGE